MQGNDSQSRFSALISGTAADQLPKSGYFSFKRPAQDGSNNNVPTRVMSPALVPRNQHPTRQLIQVNTGTTHSQHPIRGRVADKQRSQLRMPSTKPVPPYVPDSSDPPDDVENKSSSLATHNFNHSSATPHVFSAATSQQRPKSASKPISGILKPSKSLRQRLDSDDQQTNFVQDADDSSPVSVAYTSPPEERTHAPSQRTLHNTLYHNNYSRSASVVSSAFGKPGQDEDISTIMMRGATDLRNAKFENEKLHEEVSLLHSQLNQAKSEKDEILQRLHAVKDKAKQSLDSYSRSLGELRTSMEELKSQSRESFDIASQARSAFADIDSMRVTIANTIQGIEPLISENGQYFKAAEIRELISALRNSQQVTDMLRERLVSMGGDLNTARERVAELENNQAVDRATIRDMSNELSNAGARSNDLTESLHSHQLKLSEALTTIISLETKLEASAIKIKDLEQGIEKKDFELSTLNTVNDENSRLHLTLAEERGRSIMIERVQQKLDEVTLSLNETHREKAKIEGMLVDKDARITYLEGFEERLNNSNGLITELKSQIKIHEATVSVKESSLSEMTNKLLQLEFDAKSARAEILSLKESVAASGAQEEALRREVSQTMQDRQDIRAKLEAIEDALDVARRNLSAERERLQDASTRCKMIEEQFEDQSVTLSITRESNRELQDKLLESEATHARELESITGKLQCEIAILTDNKYTLQAKISDLEEVVRAQRESKIAMKSEYEVKFDKQGEAHQMEVDTIRKHANDTERALEVARLALSRLEEQTTAQRADILALREELREARLPSTVHQEAIESLNAQIGALRQENTTLILRAQTINTRYRTKDLSDEEIELINTMMATSASIHEEELVNRRNELRHRDNKIKELQERINLLESKLAKHLNTQQKINATSGAEKPSLIDPAAWVNSSDKSSSPLRVAEDDAPSTNVDNTVTARPTPVPVRPSARPPLTVVPVVTPNVAGQTIPAHVLRAVGQGTPLGSTHKVSSRHRPISPLVPRASQAAPRTPGVHTRMAARQTTGQTKQLFSKLAIDCSDDILDFEDAGQCRVSPIHNTPSPKTVQDQGLRKRIEPGDVPVQDDARRPKRPRTGTRSRPETTQVSVDAGGTPKSRPRRRR